ncbi:MULTISPECIES: lycopene cyclase family protein [unclassified Nocardia]|uniref:lycopene cyclase family protein n=1 Tax=unclassified Nocardia TaxID=2637762 RepID=UPI001CE487F0|nr:MULTISPECIES: lycopene cyclase family protein [unclassified Nocardia]
MRADIVVCGLGPAGRALAHRCLTRGLSVLAIDPHPDRAWTATYAGWQDELPDWLAPEAIAATVQQPIAWALREHRLHRPYVVLDTVRLRESLPLDGARVLADRAVELGPRTATLASGRTVTAARVIDTRGIARSPALAEQTAYGVIVDAERAAGIAPLFMDWRPDNGAESGAPPSFLYAVPLGGGSMLLEETCLAGRPAIDTGVLRERLHHRLRCRAIALTDTEPVERVRFPLEGGGPGRRRFGAAGGFTHPATGYSVAAALAAADAVAAGGTPAPVSARAVHALRNAGLRALLALPPAEIPDFFEAFFTLPDSLQRAYLSGRTDPRGTVAAMNALFAAVPARLRRRIAVATIFR